MIYIRRVRVRISRVEKVSPQYPVGEGTIVESVWGKIATVAVGGKYYGLTYDPQIRVSTVAVGRERRGDGIITKGRKSASPLTRFDSFFH